MKIALNGYGKMGRVVEQVAQEEGHEVVARFNRSTPISPDAVKGADVIIDFSVPEVLDLVVQSACRNKINLVIGTTGWSQRMDAVRGQCGLHPIGVVHSANFSPGAIIMFRLAREAAGLFGRLPEYGSGIEERHHVMKKDMPSGTALRIAAEVTEGSAGAFKPVIAVSRVGAEPGLHTVFFDSPNDLVEISHRARGRRGFAKGALLAAERIRGKVGFYSFESLFFSRGEA
jgi:4-hydroxy-tetrahydrodipicolinate reductase